MADDRLLIRSGDALLIRAGDALLIRAAVAGVSIPVFQNHYRQQADQMNYLKQSTASQAITLGPFVDSTNGDSATTSLTIANTDILLSKSGGASAAKNSGGATHDSGGIYTATLDATDTDTVGTLDVTVHVSGALYVKRSFQVLEEAIYDALIGASATGFNSSGQIALLTATQASIDAIETDTSTTLQGELDAIQAAVITNAAGTDIAADIIAVKAETASILVDTGTTLPASIATIDSNVDAILVDTGTTIPATLATIDGIVDSILVDTGATLPATLATIDSNVDAILVDTATTIPASISALNDISAADVNAQVVDVVNADLLVDGYTLTAATQIIAAACCGRVSGAGTATEVFKGLDESTTRITASVDSSGNRTDLVYV